MQRLKGTRCLESGTRCLARVGAKLQVRASASKNRNSETMDEKTRSLHCRRILRYRVPCRPRWTTLQQLSKYCPSTEMPERSSESEQREGRAQRAHQPRHNQLRSRVVLGFSGRDFKASCCTATCWDTMLYEFVRSYTILYDDAWCCIRCSARLFLESFHHSTLHILFSSAARAVQGLSSRTASWSARVGVREVGENQIENSNENHLKCWRDEINMKFDEIWNNMDIELKSRN